MELNLRELLVSGSGDIMENFVYLEAGVAVGFALYVILSLLSFSIRELFNIMKK